MTKENKDFPQTELQEKIREFWSIRGYSKVMAVLGNLNVSFHTEKPEHMHVGLSYIYLEQFWKKAQEEILIQIEDILNDFELDEMTQSECDIISTIQYKLGFIKEK